MSQSDAADLLSLSGVFHRTLVGMLNDLRKQAGLSQAELAGKTGLTQSIVAKVEVLERRTELELLIIWCDACEADPLEVIDEVMNRVRRGTPPPNYWWFRADGQRRRRTD